MSIPDHLVDVFKRELEATRSLDAAVAAVATAVLARQEEAAATPPPPPSPPVQLRALPPAHRPPCRAKVQGERVVAVRAVVARLYGETPQLLFDRHWTRRPQAPARWVAATVLRRLKMSLPDIARAVGFADHTTVLYGLRQVEARPDLAEQAEAVWREITAQAVAVDPQTDRAGAAA